MSALDCIEEESTRRLRKNLRVPQVGKGDWMVFFDTPQEFGFPDGSVRMVTELGPYTDRSEAARKLHLAGCTGRVRKAAPGVYRSEFGESRSKRIIMQVLKHARERESVSDPNWTREGLPWQVVIQPHGREPRVYGYCQSRAEGERMLRRMRMPGYVARMRRGPHHVVLV